MKFANQAVIITGASSGMGWELAKVLAREGARVGLTARRRENLVALAEEIRSTGGVAEVEPADVSDREQTAAALKSLESRLGPTDVLVANAGVGMPTTIDPVNMAEFEQMFRVNVFGVVHAFDAILPGMIARKRGHLAAVSSMAAYRGLPGEWGYTASKAAVNNLMEGLRVQLRGTGVATTNICPGFIRTPMTAMNDFHMPFALDADDAARRIAGALFRKKKVYNFPWQMRGFMWVVARLPDWVIARAMQKYNDNPPWPTPGPKGPG